MVVGTVATVVDVDKGGEAARVTDVEETMEDMTSSCRSTKVPPRLRTTTKLTV